MLYQIFLHVFRTPLCQTSVVAYLSLVISIAIQDYAFVRIVFQIFCYDLNLIYKIMFQVISIVIKMHWLKNRLAYYLNSLYSRTFF